MSRRKSEEEEALVVPCVNEEYIRAFSDNWRPAEDERSPHVRAFSVGELRDALSIYRTFDSKSMDPFPFYMNRLSMEGFRLITGLSGELVLLASPRKAPHIIVITDEEEKSISD